MPDSRGRQGYDGARPAPWVGASASRGAHRVSKDAMRSSPVAHLADSIIYLSSLLRPESRAIDRYMYYFGDGRSARPAATAGPGEPPRWPLASNDAEVKQP